MLHIDIIAIGKLKKNSLFDLQEDYRKRIRLPLTLHEVESRYKDPRSMNEDENRKILDHLSPNAFTVVMDEHGNGLRSLDFAKTLKNLEENAEAHIQFVIGGADGVNEEVKNQANMLLSFGQQTWPHMLARIMLFEQIYRTQQIWSGHPYHRE